MARKKRVPEALKKFDEAIKLRKNWEDHSLAIDYFNVLHPLPEQFIARIYRDSGDVLRAKMNYKKVINFCDGRGLKNHIMKGEAIIEIAKLTKGKKEEALAMIDEGLAVFKECVGEDHHLAK